MLIDSHCHLDFPELGRELDAVLDRARAADVGLMVTISTRVRRFDALKSHRRSASQCVLLDRDASPQCRRGARYYGGGAGRDRALIPRWWRSARPGSTIITITARATCSRKASAPISPPRARRACRSSSMPATPTPTSPACWRRRVKRARFPSCCIASPADLNWRGQGLALGGYVSFSGVITFKNAERAPRHRACRAVGPSPGRDRCALSCAGADARKDQRACFRGPYRGAPCRLCAACARTEMARLTTENFFRLFKKVPRSLQKAPQSAA